VRRSIRLNETMFAPKLPYIGAPPSVDTVARTACRSAAVPNWDVGRPKVTVSIVFMRTCFVEMHLTSYPCTTPLAKGSCTWTARH